MSGNIQLEVEPKAEMIGNIKLDIESIAEMTGEIQLEIDPKSEMIGNIKLDIESIAEMIGDIQMNIEPVFDKTDFMFKVNGKNGYVLLDDVKVNPKTSIITSEKQIQINNVPQSVRQFAKRYKVYGKVTVKSNAYKIQKDKPIIVFLENSSLTLTDQKNTTPRKEYKFDLIKDPNITVTFDGDQSPNTYTIRKQK